MNDTADLILTAAFAKLQAQKQEAKAVLMVLATKPVGIADHTKIVDEFIHWTKVMAEATDAMKTLKSEFIGQESNEVKD